MRHGRTTVFAAGVIGLACAAANAQTGRQVQFDVNSFTASLAPGSTGFRPLPTAPTQNATPTGRINFSIDDTTTVGILRGGALQQFLRESRVSNFTGFVELQNGVAVAGRFEVTVTNAGENTDTFVAQVQTGRTSFLPGQGYAVLGTYWEGRFTDADFGGVDVSDLFANQSVGTNGLLGTFLNFAFLPDENGIDDDADLDIFIDPRAFVIPLPASGAMALAGFGILGARRRR